MEFHRIEEEEEERWTKTKIIKRVRMIGYKKIVWMLLWIYSFLYRTCIIYYKRSYIYSNRSFPPFSFDRHKWLLEEACLDKAVQAWCMEARSTILAGYRRHLKFIHSSYIGYRKLACVNVRKLPWIFSFFFLLFLKCVYKIFLSSSYIFKTWNN